MNLNEKLTEAQALLKQEEETLKTLNETHYKLVKDQNLLIKEARQKCRFWDKLIKQAEKAETKTE